MSSDLRSFISSSSSPASSSSSPASSSSSAQMSSASSSSSWTKENLISQSVPLPAKLKPATTTTMTTSSSGVGTRDFTLPLITLSSKGSPASSSTGCGFRMGDPAASAGGGVGLEGPRCLSLPLSRVHDQIQQRQPKPQHCDPTPPPYTNCSSSLDNLSLCAPSSGPSIPIGGGGCGGGVGVPHGRLIKASSDNPVYGLSASPPIPPRDYIPRAISRPTVLLDQRPHHPHQQTMSGARTPEIHPIVQDGQKRSNTHYWLLPDKQKMTSASLDDVDKMTSAEEEPQQHYVNIASATAAANNNNNGLWARTFGISKTSSFGKKGGSARKDETRRSHHASEGAADPRTCHGSIFYSDVVPLLSDVSSLDSMSVNIPVDEMEDDRMRMIRSVYPSGGTAEEDGGVVGGRTTSMGEVKTMIETVQSKINGVTADESFTALATNQWNVDAAVEYLKVENLFRLGLASRERCRRKLEINDWSVERAASDLLDLLGIDLSK